MPAKKLFVIVLVIGLLLVTTFFFISSAQPDEYDTLMKKYEDLQKKKGDIVSVGDLSNLSDAQLTELLIVEEELLELMTEYVEGAGEGGAGEGFAAAIAQESQDAIDDINDQLEGGVVPQPVPVVDDPVVDDPEDLDDFEQYYVEGISFSGYISYSDSLGYFLNDREGNRIVIDLDTCFGEEVPHGEEYYVLEGRLFVQSPHSYTLFCEVTS